MRPYRPAQRAKVSNRALPSACHRALNPYQRDELANCDSPHHTSLEDASDPFTWYLPESPQRLTVTRHLLWHIRPFEGMARIPENELNYGGLSTSTPMIKKDIYEEQPEREDIPSGIFGRTRKDLLEGEDADTRLKIFNWTWSNQENTSFRHRHSLA